MFNPLLKISKGGIYMSPKNKGRRKQEEPRSRYARTCHKRHGRAELGRNFRKCSNRATRTCRRCARSCRGEHDRARSCTDVQTWHLMDQYWLRPGMDVRRGCTDVCSSAQTCYFLHVRAMPGRNFASWFSTLARPCQFVHVRARPSQPKFLNTLTP